MSEHDPQLLAKLDALEAELPKRLEQSPDEADFWPWFTLVADDIVRSVEGDEAHYAQGRVDCMLKNAGLIPGEDEGEPCQ